MTQPDATEAIAAQLLDVVPQIRGMVTRFVQQHSDELHLTMLEFDVLRTIEPGNSWMKELAGRNVISRPAVTKIVARLVDKGFVERRESARDRRAKRLRLTRRGRTVLRRAGERVATFLDQYVAALSRPAQIDLQRGLAALAQVLAAGRPAA